MERLHAWPNMIAGENIVDTVLTAHDDLIGKSGAMGVYAVGCKSRRLGMVFKTADGSHDEFAASVVEAFRQLNIAPDAAEEIKKLYPDHIVNDNRFVVGNRKAVFKLV